VHGENCQCQCTPSNQGGVLDKALFVCAFSLTAHAILEAKGAGGSTHCTSRHTMRGCSTIHNITTMHTLLDWGRVVGEALFFCAFSTVAWEGKGGRWQCTKQLQRHHTNPTCKSRCCLLTSPYAQCHCGCHGCLVDQGGEVGEVLCNLPDVMSTFAELLATKTVQKVSKQMDGPQWSLGTGWRLARGQESTQQRRNGNGLPPKGSVT